MYAFVYVHVCLYDTYKYVCVCIYVYMYTFTFILNIIHMLYIDKYGCKRV